MRDFGAVYHLELVGGEFQYCRAIDANPTNRSVCFLQVRKIHTSRAQCEVARFERRLAVATSEPAGALAWGACERKAQSINSGRESIIRLRHERHAEKN